MIGRSVGRVWRSGRGEWKLYMLSVFSLAVAFVCLASALLVVVNLHAVELRWARAGRISVYLRDGASDEKITTLKRALEQSPEVTAARFVSASDARKDMIDDGLSGSLAVLPVEAFPASFELSLADDVESADVASMAEKLRVLPMVESVETYERWTDRLASLMRGGVVASAILALVVFAAVISVIGSTMRLALHRRRIEVEVLKLVGATDSFVRGPFLIEGAMQGALGALVSLGLLGVLYLVVRGRFDDELGLLLGINPTFLPWEIALGMVAVGGVLGAASAFAGVRRLAAV
ncbi:MAG TPA: permease-like cell division protein FtsX [Polyangiaceae bacterium]|nr:permease-like cell division protein FtsX [Polyangiaceae bacterium]